MRRCTECGLPADDARVACEACGSLTFLLESDLIDGRYFLENELGHGAMGVVYRGRDITLGRKVAVKLIAASIASLPGTIGRFQREAAALAAIRNEHVVQVYAFGPHAGSFYFAMEYVGGRSVEDIIAEHAFHDSFVPIHRALTILIQVAAGLAAAHGAGILHRDVKPANVVIEEDSGRPVLVDFGLAHRAEPGREAERNVGTPAFMAPEQGPIQSGPLTPATDVYGLACTAFDLLTNRTPFMADTLMPLFRLHALKDAPRLSSFRAELAPLDEVIERALAKRPDHRYQSCTELRDALERAGQRWLQLPTLPSAPVAAVAPVAARPSDAAPVRRILVVDDDEAFRRFATRAAELAFQGSPLAVSAVGSGSEAIESATRKMPELVILDFDMPGLDGVATLSALRGLPGGTASRVVVVSARAGAEERWKFGVLGVGDFVAKPVDLPALVQALTVIAEKNGWV